MEKLPESIKRHHCEKCGNPWWFVLEDCYACTMCHFEEKREKWSEHPHLKEDCKGEFKQEIKENVPYAFNKIGPEILRFASFVHCSECEATYFTKGYEHFAETMLAINLWQSKTSLTEQEKKFLKLYFQMVDATFKIHGTDDE